MFKFNKRAVCEKNQNFFWYTVIVNKKTRSFYEFADKIGRRVGKIYQ